MSEAILGFESEYVPLECPRVRGLLLRWGVVQYGLSVSVFDHVKSKFCTDKAQVMDLDPLPKHLMLHVSSYRRGGCVFELVPRCCR